MANHAWIFEKPMAPTQDDAEENWPPRRIVVVGNAGGGKSTLARKLAGLLAIPYHAMDDIQWAPGWTRVSDEVIAVAHSAWLGEPAWIIDGYGPLAPMIDRFRKADLIILVDHPFWRHLWWVTKRQFRAYIGPPQPTPPPTPPGCDYRGIYWSMIWMMWQLHRERRQIDEVIVQEAGPGCRVRVLRSAAEISTFFSAIEETHP
jgi:hypothetical protein